MSFRWTEENFRELRELVGMGLSASQTARRMGVTRNAVTGKALRNGLHFGSDSPKNTAARAPRAEYVPSAPRLQRVKALAPPPSEPEPIGPLEMLPSSKCCQWIEGDPAKPGWRACGHPGFPWCEHHHARAFVKADGRRARHVWKGPTLAKAAAGRAS